MELKYGSGNRYNPDIVNMILTHNDVIKEITRILEEERPLVYYELYKELNN